MEIREITGLDYSMLFYWAVNKKTVENEDLSHRSRRMQTFALNYIQ